MKAVPGAIADFATEFGKAAITPPKEGFLDVAGAPKRVADLFKGVASGATAGIYKPEVDAEDEAAKARQMLGSLGGFAVPFTGAAKAARLAGAGKLASQVIAGAGTGAIAPAVEGDISGAVTGAGAALVGGAAVAGRLFQKVYGRAPKNVDEIKARVNDDAAFRRELAEFPDERLGAEKPASQDARQLTIGDELKSRGSTYFRSAASD